MATFAQANGCDKNRQMHVERIHLIHVRAQHTADTESKKKKGEKKENFSSFQRRSFICGGAIP